jgi:predicted transport protein
VVRKPLTKKPLRAAVKDVPARAWACPKCGRAFTQKNQRHACGTGNRSEVLRNRPDSLVKLYDSLEAFARSLGKVEIVARERYVLLRSQRIFTDVVIMTDALRIAVHLKRQVNDPLFFKVASDKRHVTHVAKLRTPKDFDALKPYLREAFEASLEPGKTRG